MSTRSPVDRVTARAVERAIAETSGQRLAFDRGVYGRLAARGLSRRDIRRALDDLEAAGRIVLYCCGAGGVAARLTRAEGER